MHSSPALPTAAAAARSSSDVAASLRQDILSGSRKPGERVLLQELRQVYGTSLSPIREGLSQLVAERLLVASGQRGYRVAPISLAEFEDIKARRLDLECMALAASIHHGSEDWEIGLMTHFQRLRQFESRRWHADQINAWEERHHAFHQALISACESPILMRFCARLHDMADRYRRVLMKTHDPDRDVAQEHQALHDAALARDPERACQVLRAHIDRTSRTVLQMLRAHGPQ